jgi:hypothetical protein
VNDSLISATDLRGDEAHMKAAAEIGMLCRVATARMPTRWGMLNAAGFEPPTAGRPGSDERPARAGSGKPTCVALDLNLIKRRADYVNH